ncbi:serine/arginine-rich SC35-like splicing factor SCL33 [Artemisia annua]|uniref:Serine/arginine-rich SC35-like splicing factor SCL33 n=1 Tax=Artemisia annua TaxID=35608 RepID=A0A2U1MGC4_ARTAN|nr:serine/arginine-rich SC35-like splicing factor SCL33 [Artemisia annua]
MKAPSQKNYSNLCSDRAAFAGRVFRLELGSPALLTKAHHLYVSLIGNTSQKDMTGTFFIKNYSIRIKTTTSPHSCVVPGIESGLGLVMWINVFKIVSWFYYLLSESDPTYMIQGHCQFLDHADASKAKYQMDGRVVKDRQLIVVFAAESRTKPTDILRRECRGCREWGNENLHKKMYIMACLGTIL